MAGKAHRSGGARPGAGRPRSSKPRCACDKHTLDHAWKNRLKCGGAARLPAGKKPREHQPTRSYRDQRHGRAEPDR